VNQLGRYLESTNRTTDEVAVDLSALLGKPITAQSVLLWSRRRKPPKAWAAALSLPDEVADPQEERYLDDDVPAGTERLLRDDDAPPAPLDPSRVVRPVLPDSLAAKKRISFAYSAIGGGVSEITGNQGVGAVMDSYSPALADAWLKAAAENENVAKIVRFLDSGGPVGELVFMHLLLVGAILYVSGRGPDALDAVYGKFGGYRATALRQRAAGAEEAGFDGAGQRAAADPLAGAQG
jgi:hypothetical protein